MFENIETVIFDFGGTLDTNGIPLCQMFLEILKAEGFIINDKSYCNIFEESEKYIKCNIDNISFDYKKLLKEQLAFIISKLHLLGYENKYNRERFINEIIFEIWSEIKNNLSNSKEILETLKKRYKLCLVSNFYGNLEEICVFLDFHQYFNVILDSTNTCIQKPHPGIFSIVLKKLNSLPEKTIVVGDSYEEDIVPSKIIGCKTIWLNKSKDVERANYESADYIITDLNVIKDFTKKILKI